MLQWHVHGMFASTNGWWGRAIISYLECLGTDKQLVESVEQMLIEGNVNKDDWYGTMTVGDFLLEKHTEYAQPAGCSRWLVQIDDLSEEVRPRVMLADMAGLYRGPPGVRWLGGVTCPGQRRILRTWVQYPSNAEQQCLFLGSPKIRTLGEQKWTFPWIHRWKFHVFW